MHGYTERRQKAGGYREGEGLGVETLEARMNLSAVSTLLNLPGLVAGASLSTATVAPSTRLIEVGTVPQAAASAPRPTAETGGVVDLTTPPRRYRHGGWAATTDSAKQLFFDTVLRQRTATPVQPEVAPETPTMPIANPTTVSEKVTPTVQLSLKVTPDATGVQLTGPVRGLTWSANPTGTTNLTDMLWATQASDPAALAKQSLKAPAGNAGMFLWDMADGLLGDPLDNAKRADGTLTAYRGPWMDHGVATVKARMETFFSAYKAAGGKLDVLILDYEAGISNWQLSNESAAAIQNDPRTAALLKSLGITSMADVMNVQTHEFVKWNDAMSDLMNKALNTAIFDVAKKYFPDVRSSNYDSYAMTKENLVPELNGNLMTPPSHAGTTNAPVLYGQMGNLSSAQLVDGQAYGNSKLAVLRWQVNLLRSINLSSADGATPWISYESYTGSQLKNSAYYDELIYQLAMSGAKEFLVWNPKPYQGGQNPADWSSDAQAKALDAALADVNAHLGDGPRTVVTPKLMAWDSNLVVSGVQVGDKVEWRVSAPEGMTQVKIAETGQVVDLNGSAGAWFESKAGESVTFVAMK